MTREFFQINRQQGERVQTPFTRLLHSQEHYKRSVVFTALSPPFGQFGLSNVSYQGGKQPLSRGC